MNKKFLQCFLIGTISSPCIAQQYDSCVQAYANTLAAYNQQDVLYTGLQSLYSKLCSSSSSSSSSSTDAGLQAVIYSVPIVASWAQKNNVTNNSSFCDAYRRDTFINFASHTYASSPVPAAQTNFNQCETILQGSKVSVTHEQSPGSVAISFQFHDAQTQLQIQGVTMDSPSQPFSCVAVPGNNQPLEESSSPTFRSNFTIQCKRAGQHQADGNVYYGPDVIRVGTSQGASYTVVVDEDTIYGPTDQKKVQSELDLLRPFANSTLSITGFNATSGPDPKGALFGENVGWGTVTTHTQDVWEPGLKHKYCPNALKVQTRLVANPGANCCGNLQYVMVCLSPGTP
jgi:hypothetical protein